MSSAATRISILIVLLGAGAAQAQTLYEQDGIRLLGTVRRIEANAATCRVLESDIGYEAQKANDGQPLHVWQLDFAARNDSGWRLEHLTAHFSIASEWLCSGTCGNGSWTGTATIRAAP